MARHKKKIVEGMAGSAEAMAAQILEENKAPAVASIQASAEIVEIVTELRRLEDLKKQLLELEEIHKQKIMSFMGMHHQLKNGYFTLASWKAQTRKSFDTSAFKGEFAELYESYMKEVNFRVFRLC